MTKLLSILFAASITLSCSCAHAPKPKPVPDIAAETIPNVVSLREDGNTFCSGFVIKGTGLIATADHCVDAGGFFFEVEWEGEVFNVAIVDVDEFEDAAILRPIDFVIPPEAGLVLSNTPVVAGQLVVSVGHALGIHQDTVTTGIVSHPHQELDSGQYYIMVDSAILGGMSGGPSVNSYGEVIGINIFSLVDQTLCLDAVTPCEPQFIRSPLHGLSPVETLKQLLSHRK